MATKVMARSWDSETDPSAAQADGGFSSADIQAIVRAWKGETVEGNLPMSPVGQADFDGSLALGKLNGGGVYAGQFAEVAQSGEKVCTVGAYMQFAPAYDTGAASCPAHKSF